ncbi:MAG: D-Ala-D-Ala carboxypeptidase family metallohydrolase [Akkermansiaceae bacterium]|jgi:hypothetical protein|nr:D-Ala-D-Ala carboxypeptidase family metallohydrolase [Akkermansiaceae bacterium]
MSLPEIPDLQKPFVQLPLSRRSVLGTLGLAGLGLLAGAGAADASSAANRIDLSGLSADWVRLQDPRTVVEYARFIHALRLRYITTEQVIASHAKSISSVWNTLPPKAWWNRMGYTLRVVDRVAQELRQPVTEVLSAYRSPSYNIKCRGARCSWHQANMAVDVRFGAKASAVTATARSLRDRGLFKGGVGGYSNFTHIDTRGQNINW